MARSKRPRIDPMEVVKANIAALPAKNDPNLVKVAHDYRRSAYALVIEAAKARRMSVPAYIRRASLAFACRDLRIPFTEALRRDPRITRDTGHNLLDPSGALFGPWEIERLVGEAADE